MPTTDEPTTEVPNTDDASMIDLLHQIEQDNAIDGENSDDPESLDSDDDCGSMPEAPEDFRAIQNETIQDENPVVKA